MGCHATENSIIFLLCRNVATSAVEDHIGNTGNAADNFFGTISSQSTGIPRESAVSALCRAVIDVIHFLSHVVIFLLVGGWIQGDCAVLIEAFDNAVSCFVCEIEMVGQTALLGKVKGDAPVGSFAGRRQLDSRRLITENGAGGIQVMVHQHDTAALSLIAAEGAECPVAQFRVNDLDYGLCEALWQGAGVGVRIISLAVVCVGKDAVTVQDVVLTDGDIQ